MSAGPKGSLVNVGGSDDGGPLSSNERTNMQN